MGMFDTIKVIHKCQVCGARSNNYQTKEISFLRGLGYLRGTLDVYKLGDKIIDEDGKVVEDGNFEIHDFCNRCGSWVDGKGYIKKGIITKIVEYNVKAKANIKKAAIKKKKIVAKL